MKLGEIKVLILDDDIYKAMAVQRALRDEGVRKIEVVSDQQSGMDYVYDCMIKEDPVNLIVTDMQYPLKQGGRIEIEAGFELIERLENEKIEIPVIICSSCNYKDSRALGTIWFNPSRDLKTDMKELLEKLYVDYRTKS